MSQRQAEIEKYTRAYQDPHYRMGDQRHRDAVAALFDLPVRSSLLDVGAGRGELIQSALALGFDQVQGTDVVPSLCRDNISYAEVHAIPFEDGEFDVVTCLDVLEHILPEDTDQAVSELARVTRSVAVISVANFSDVWHGVELHINRRAYDEWHVIFATYFEQVQRLDCTTPMWICENGLYRKP